MPATQRLEVFVAVVVAWHDVVYLIRGLATLDAERVRGLAPIAVAA
jgi:hypothetical protein